MAGTYTKGNTTIKVDDEAAQEAKRDPIQEIADAGAANTAENKAAIDAWAAEAQARVDRLGANASQNDRDILAQLAAGGNYAIKANDVILANLVKGNTGPIEYGAQQADVVEDPYNVDAQRAAIEKYKGLTDPTVTAKEKFLQMQSRVGEERSRKSAMDAALSDMQRRGVRSGGAEVSAMLGAQQTTSQSRLMQDLGTQAGAVDRSMQAIEGLGRVSGQARNTAAQVAEFNSTQGAQYQRDLAGFKAGERDAAWGRTTDISDKASGNVDDYLAILTGQKSAELGASNAEYGRGIDSVGVGRDAVGMTVGAGNTGFQTFAEVEKMRLAEQKADEAAKKLKRKTFWEEDPLPLKLW